MSHPTLSPPPYRDVTVGDLLARLAHALPDSEALVYRDGPRLTFGALEREARIIARGLMALGVERGERVVLWATNVPEWIVLQFAVAKAGAILVTANTSLRGRDLDGDGHHHPRLPRGRLRQRAPRDRSAAGRRRA